MSRGLHRDDVCALPPPCVEFHPFFTLRVELVIIITCFFFLGGGGLLPF